MPLHDFRPSRIRFSEASIREDRSGKPFLEVSVVVYDENGNSMGSTKIRGDVPPGIVQALVQQINLLIDDIDPDIPKDKPDWAGGSNGP